jgi:hypothetical protein
VTCAALDLRVQGSVIAIVRALDRRVRHMALCAMLIDLERLVDRG